MNAVISGRAGLALVADGDALYSIHAGDPTERIDRRPEDFWHLFGDARDFEVVEQVNAQTIARRLAEAVDGQEVLDLTLILLDGDLSSETRAQAAEELDALLERATAAECAEYYLFAHPLPSEADLVGAFAACGSPFARTLAFLRRIDGLQPAIREVQIAWDGAVHLIGSQELSPAQLRSLAAQRGLLREMVLVACGEKMPGSAKFNALRLLQEAKVPNCRQFVTEWMRDLSFNSNTFGEEQIQESTEAQQQETVGSNRPQGRKRMGADEALAKVDSQKQYIRKLLGELRLDEARIVIDELVGSQLANGGAKFACKSLCDLAMTAQELGLRTFQLELTQRSIDLSSVDGWAWSQHGQALLNLNEFDAANEAFRLAAALQPSDAVGKSGLARVLKAQGKLAEALDVYEEISRQHPEDVFAKNGRAEVLKAQGKLAEALEVYEETARQHPEDVVAKTGRAEVLKAQGKLAEALDVYEEIARQHPEDVVAKNGRAEVLKAQGKLAQALEVYEEIARQHPEDVFAKNGRAEVLKAQGKLAEALEVYEEIARQHPEDVFAKNGRGEVLKAQGKLAEALEVYEEIARQHPEDVVAKNGRAEVLKAQGKLAQALEVYEEIARQHPEDVFAKNGRAEVLKAQGKLAEALEVYEEIARQHPEDVVAKTGRAEVLKAQGKLAEALDVYEEIARQHPEDVVAKNGRAEVLKAQGKLAEALEVYEEIARQHPEDVVAKTGRAEVLKAQGKLAEALEVYEEIARQHPEDVFAKNGRAEVLKAQGKLDEALAAYNEIVDEHPYSVFSKIARASLLAMGGHTEEAIAAVDTFLLTNGKGSEFMGEDYWVACHIKGMIILKNGDLERATEILRHGLEDCPFAKHRDYFRTALAVARLRSREFAAATEVLNGVTTPELKNVASVLRIHAFGESREYEMARDIYLHLDQPTPIIADVYLELHRRYVERTGGQHDDAWLIDREFAYVLAA